ncbi:MAG: cytochrome c biogenesis protein CcdA [Pseudomonadota bacterium]|nr:cytochrome c biogenesis protein CcdA [Pseudomonadota bacterium]
MSELVTLVLLPIGLGLLGFVEPCSIGSSLLFLRYLAGKPVAAQRTEMLTFLLARATFMGGLGAIAVLVGNVFGGFQRAGWLALGVLYLTLGLLYLAGRANAVFRSIGLSLDRFSGRRGAISLGLLFGLNVPACAAPLLVALLGQAAFGVAGVAAGFFSLALFGIALSAPLLAAVWSNRLRGWLDWLSSLAPRVPIVIGTVLILAGAWSAYQGFA